MLHQVFQVERLVASYAVYAVCVEHLKDESGRWPVTTIQIFAYFTFFLILLQVLVVHFHVEAVGAVELAALRIVTFDWCVHNFYIADGWLERTFSRETMNLLWQIAQRKSSLIWSIGG